MGNTVASELVSIVQWRVTCVGLDVGDMAVSVSYRGVCMVRGAIWIDGILDASEDVPKSLKC